MTQPGSPASQIPERTIDALLRQIRNLERRVTTVERQRSLEAATIGGGGLTIHTPGKFQVVDDGGTIFDSDRDLSIPFGWSQQVSGLNFTGTFTNYMDPQIHDIPYGMSGVTIILNTVAGETLSGSPGVGNISVGGAIEWFDAAGTSLGVGVGLYQNSGQNTIPVAYSFTTVTGTLDPSFAKFRIGVSVADSIGTSTRVANTGNWSGSMLAVFSRQ